jgi:hypothetical protein
MVDSSRERERHKLLRVNCQQVLRRPSEPAPSSGSNQNLATRRMPICRLIGANLGRLGIGQLRQAAKARHDFLPVIQPNFF